MASIIPRTLRARPIVASAVILGVAGAAYYTSIPRVRLDSAHNAPTKTFAIPTSMLFSRQLTVTNIEQINHDTKKITFRLPGGEDEVAGVAPGAAILTQHTPTGRWFPVMRPYTPIHEYDERGVLQLLVKKYPQGAASTHMHELSPGSTLTVRGPLPGYSWKPSSIPRDVLFVAGGAGITPIYSLTRGVLRDEHDKTRIQLLWGVNGTQDIVLKNELEALEKAYPDRLRVTYCVSGAEAKPGAPSLGDEDKFRKGYVDKTVLQEAVQRCGQGSFGDEKGTKVWLCGPPAMEEAVAGKKGALGELGIEKKNIHRF